MAELMKDQRNLITVTGFTVEITPDHAKNKELTLTIRHERLTVQTLEMRLKS